MLGMWTKVEKWRKGRVNQGKGTAWAKVWCQEIAGHAELSCSLVATGVQSSRLGVVNDEAGETQAPALEGVDAR